MTVTKPRIRPFPIIQLGHPTLWQKSEHVSKDQDLSHIISRMFKTLRHADGAGLAAPQINQSLRLFVMDIHPTPRRPKIKKSGELVIINPRIISQSEEVEEDWEGCLSVTTTSGLVFGKVPRARKIEVTYEDASRTEVKRQLVDFDARVFLHEFDHLEGIVFLQRMSKLNELIDEKTYIGILKSSNSTKM
ncbi:MAG: peptide deformylase [bacterium]